MPIFLTGFIQVFFVAINTYFISQANYIGTASASFIISFVWSYNVRKVAFGNIKERLLYASGACIGGLTGLYLSNNFIN